MQEVFSVDDGDGNQITTGLQPHEALTVARRIADERQQTVYLYSGPNTPLAVRPTALEYPD